MSSETMVRLSPGMGAVAGDGGVTFRVWAPNASAVSVIGDFDEWGAGVPLEREETGNWAGFVEGAGPGSAYLFRIRNGENEFTRIDPYAREVINSVGHGVVTDSGFDWEDDAFQPPPRNELVIYELHVGTFNAKPGEPGGFDSIVRRFDHLKALGVTALEVMPIAEFAGDYSWGYNPAHIFAVESAYGGPAAFKNFVKLAHRAGFAVILDVVYNHFGPSDLSLWQFDGWSENGGGGIYFYNDWRAETPWGATRPDYGRPEVRQYIRDNAMMWINDYHVDGLRMDMTLYMRHVRGDGDPAGELPDGWSLAQWISEEVQAAKPQAILIAEDLRDNSWLTKSTGEGGAGFHAQWTAGFVHPLRDTVIKEKDEWREIAAVRSAILHNFNGDPLQRVIYSESHDEVANGKARVPHEVSPHDPGNWFAQKRASLAAAVVLTAPGIPMLFQGQEFLQPGWFDDGDPLDWYLKTEYRGIVRLFRDLIALRRNTAGQTRGLLGWGVNVHHVNEQDKVLGWHRWAKGGVSDDVVILANFSARNLEDYRFGLPRPGVWRLLMNSDWSGYSPDFSGVLAGDVHAEPQPYDGYACSAAVALPAYSVLIFSFQRSN